MSIGFNWFKDYKITKDILDYGICSYDIYKLEYIGGSSTSYSSRNIIKVDELLNKYGNVVIPTIDSEFIDSIDYDLGLIKPNVLSEACEVVIKNLIISDPYDMMDRIKWIKKLSDEGYYVSYDMS